MPMLLQLLEFRHFTACLEYSRPSVAAEDLVPFEEFTKDVRATAESCPRAHPCLYSYAFAQSFVSVFCVSNDYPHLLSSRSLVRTPPTKAATRESKERHA